MGKAGRNKISYIDEYNKEKYYKYDFRLKKKEDYVLIDRLNSFSSRSGFIRDLLFKYLVEMDGSPNHQIIITELDQVLREQGKDEIKNKLSISACLVLYDRNLITVELLNALLANVDLIYLPTAEEMPRFDHGPLNEDHKLIIDKVFAYGRLVAKVRSSHLENIGSLSAKLRMFDEHKRELAYIDRNYNSQYENEFNKYRYMYMKIHNMRKKSSELNINSLKDQTEKLMAKVKLLPNDERSFILNHYCVNCNKTRIFMFGNLYDYLSKLKNIENKLK